MEQVCVGSKCLFSVWPPGSNLNSGPLSKGPLCGQEGCVVLCQKATLCGQEGWCWYYSQIVGEGTCDCYIYNIYIKLRM